MWDPAWLSYLVTKNYMQNLVTDDNSVSTDQFLYLNIGQCDSSRFHVVLLKSGGQALVGPRTLKWHRYTVGDVGGVCLCHPTGRLYRKCTLAAKINRPATDASAAGRLQFYPPVTLFMTARCIARGVRRFENMMILFMNPATTEALLCDSARRPLSATGRGFIVRIRSMRETGALAAESNPVSVCPGQRQVTVTPRWLSSSCKASPNDST